jgi:LPXTG-motif cell wall-anchored protein
MKKNLKFTIPVFGLILVMIFCLSAPASIAPVPQVANWFLSEPINLLFLGIALIGFSGLIKKRRKG